MPNAPCPITNMNTNNIDLLVENPDTTNLFQLPPEAKRIPAWRIWIPLLVQIGLIAAVPAQSVYTFVTGKTVILQTLPVDPYDLLRGYYQVLSYDISQNNNLEKLPGWKDLPSDKTPCPPGTICQDKKTHNVKTGTSFYVIMESPKDAANSASPKAWKPVRVSLENPSNLPANQIALQGKYDGRQMEYGLETYYMPENEREKVNQDIGQAQMRERQSFVVEVKVDKTGHAVPVSLWVHDRNYRF